jgi:hypothetical protein
MSDRTPNSPTDRGRQTGLASNESIVQVGTFVHGGIEGDVRIVQAIAAAESAPGIEPSVKWT